ncbi:MAG: chromate transporter [Clostridia bacterium]|nr:chromate transporter [Clostridia bacterium]
MPILLDLFITFFKLGLFTFGGGYAMIPILTDDVLAHGWLVQEEIMNFIAVAESTPGPIAINMATFIGASQGGFFGAVLATLGVVLPSFIIILLIASVIKGLMKFAGVKAFLSGVRPVVVGLILATGIGMMLTVLIGLEQIGEKVAFDWKALVIFAIIAATHIVWKRVKKKAPSPIILILISACLGMIFYGLIP